MIAGLTSALPSSRGDWANSEATEHGTHLGRDRVVFDEKAKGSVSEPLSRRFHVSFSRFQPLSHLLTPRLPSRL
jgi:hypothetical protein